MCADPFPARLHLLREPPLRPLDSGPQTPLHASRSPPPPPFALPRTSVLPTQSFLSISLRNPPLPCFLPHRFPPAREPSARARFSRTIADSPWTNKSSECPWFRYGRNDAPQ